MNAALSLPGVSVTRSAHDAHTWSYLPTSPGPELGPDGRPTVSLLVHPDGTATLQLGARLDPPAARIEELRTLVASSGEAVEPALLRLTSAVRRVDGVDLVVGRQSGPETVASSTGSGYPPWTALLVAELDAEATTAAAAALHGRTGQLTVTYHLSLTDGTDQHLSTDVGEWPAAP